ncbi:hypothetical protein CGK93_09720 [Arthrobacter sp. YN]|nr:hypothetical protein CGK93_09720 [Arthrobacter sp. YN]
MPKFVQNELLPMKSRRADCVQNNLDVLTGQPQAADRAAVQSSGSFYLYWPMPNAFDYLDQTFQVEVSREL